MKRLLILTLMLACLAFAATSFAETNGQEQATSTVTTTSSQALVSVVQGRIAAIVAPTPSGGDQAANDHFDEDGQFAFSVTGEDLGLASGEEGNNFGLWGMGSYTYFASQQSNARYDADAFNGMLGFDWRATQDLLVGVAAGYGNLDLDKHGWSGDSGTLSTEHEWTVMPYMAYNLTDLTIADFAFAYTDSRYKDDDGTNVGKYDSTRYLTSLGLSQYYLYDAWTFSGRLGYMYVHGDLSSYSRGGTNIANPDSYMGQVSGEAKAAYYFDAGFQPYAALRYFYDTQSSSRPVNSDYDEFGSVLGMNWFATDQWVVNLETGATMGRDKFESYRGQFNVRYEF